MAKGKHKIVVTEIPYQVNKARVIETIANLSRDKVIDGITALRDESDRQGMRIVIELRADVQPDIVLNKLYKHTQLQESFGVIMLAPRGWSSSRIEFLKRSIGLLLRSSPRCNRTPHTIRA